MDKTNKIHIKEIENTMKELELLQKRTAAPAETAHQYIGTICDNTLALLTAPANSLDGGCRNIQFTQHQNWLELMKSVHRSFLSSLHTATEMCFDVILKPDTKIGNGRQENLLKKLEKFQIEDENLKIFIKDIIKNITKHTGFMDKLEAILNIASLSKEDKKNWRNFFDALRIVRNKVSHSDCSLSQHEKEILEKGELKNLVSKSGTLQANTKMYGQLAKLTLDFFDQVYKSI